ncbi:fatty acid desaturase family protein [Botrimarina hoheduenensis]|uniref:fatty acid desaturase family protein n=1 Tax=Botrimarina hoheduenensis TaxID=2528000 RepID=UPI0018D3B145|nr:fatty acid desaturase [Botrimarina hoheduenensis]
MREARALLGDDLRPKPWVYWTDLVLSWSGAMVTFKAVQIGSLGVPLRVLAFVVSCLLLYRCALFIHELAHLPQREFRAFRFVWNLLCGIPMLIPTFVYQTHLDHHRRKHYGTNHDGEYLPLLNRPVWHAIGYVAQSLVIPLLAIIRFGLLTPLTWISGPTRDWVHRHASSMIIDPRYLRPLPSRKALRGIRYQELGCFLFLAAMTFGVVRSLYGQGFLDPWFLPQLYATAVAIVTLNAVRTLGAHRYVNDADANHDRPMTFVEQLLDSVNYPNHAWASILWGPIGTRYHALHHLFPSLPYHALETAHRRLMAGLPADSPYRKTTGQSLLHEVGQLLRHAGRRAEQPGG